jgi:GNAT superfamily N-acetyltransferase
MLRTPSPNDVPQRDPEPDSISFALRRHQNIVVERSCGAGLGKHIMPGTLQAAWDAGCYKVMLMTGSRRPTTHAFYRACGYSAEDKTGYVARPP